MEFSKAKVMKGLECCLSETPCVECPYQEMQETSLCDHEIMKDALELLKGPELRVLTLDEVLHGSGGGYIEEWYRGDEEDPEGKSVCECGYVKGNVITEDGSSISAIDLLEAWYNKPYGMRIWTVKPTEEDQEMVKWDG